MHAANISIFPISDKFWGRKNFTRFHKKQIEKRKIDEIDVFYTNRSCNASRSVQATTPAQSTRSHNI